MTHNQLKMRCDLFKTGANTHKIIGLYSNVVGCIELYLMNDGYDDRFAAGVEYLQELNKIIGTNADFIDLVKSYVPVFNEQWGAAESLRTLKKSKDSCNE